MKSLGGANMFMAVSIVVFIILGSVLEGIPAIVLFETGTDRSRDGNSGVLLDGGDPGHGHRALLFVRGWLLRLLCGQQGASGRGSALHRRLSVALVLDTIVVAAIPWTRSASSRPHPFSRRSHGASSAGRPPWRRADS